MSHCDRLRAIECADDAWGVIGPNTPQKPDRTVPEQLSKRAILTVEGPSTGGAFYILRPRLPR